MSLYERRKEWWQGVSLRSYLLQWKFCHFPSRLPPFPLMTSLWTFQNENLQWKWEITSTPKGPRANIKRMHCGFVCSLVQWIWQILYKNCWKKRKQISEVLEIILSYLRLGLCRDGLHITRGKITMLEAALWLLWVVHHHHWHWLPTYCRGRVRWQACRRQRLAGTDSTTRPTPEPAHGAKPAMGLFS